MTPPAALRLLALEESTREEGYSYLSRLGKTFVTPQRDFKAMGKKVYGYLSCLTPLFFQGGGTLFFTILAQPRF